MISTALDMVQYQWVKRNYFGKHAEKVAELANRGVGYINLGENGKNDITVALRVPVNSIKNDMEVMCDYDAERMDLIFNRQGM